jgi:hypothetical protein
MKINLGDIKVPLEKTVEFKNGEYEISLSKMKPKQEYLYKSFMSLCAANEEDLVNTAGMSKEATMSTCAMQFDKMKKMMMEKSTSGELTPGQKKLPPALQKAILKKMDSPDDSDEHENEESDEMEKTEEGK